MGKAKELTFVWQNMTNNTVNLKQWRTLKRTVAEAAAAVEVLDGRA